MRIIISGAGDIGIHLVKLLTLEEHDITLIDSNQSKLDYANSHHDVAIIKGSSTSYRVLEEAGVRQADMLISVTQFEETNIITAILARKLGTKKTVARIQNTEYLTSKDVLNLRDLGIDEIISPESLAAREIKRLIRETAVTDIFDFDDGKLSLVGTTINENSEFNNKSLIELSQSFGDHNFINVALLRETKTIIPNGESRFETGDHAYFVTLPQGTNRILQLSGQEKKKQEIRRIMVLGGSKIGYHSAKVLGKKFKVKLIEQNRDKCFDLADQLPNVMVINGDGRDVDFLKENSIDEMDAFMAVTGNSETNIISCLVAKEKGVKKTIALVENIDYIHLSQNIGVDTMINKKLIAANFIFRSVRKGDIISLTSIHGVDAEVVEFIVKDKSKITLNLLKDMNFPKGAIIGGVIRKGEGMIPYGDFQIRPKDRAVVLCKTDCIHDVEEFF
jgi:trk system potassium uptake protein TrkA